MARRRSDTDLTNEPAAGRPSAVTTVLVLGGASDIGLAIVRRLATEGLTHAVLACRAPELLDQRLAKRPIDGVVATTVVWDALQSSAHAPLLAEASALLGGNIDLVVCAVGSLGHHSGLTMSAADADLLVRTNAAGPIAALLETARVLLAQSGGGSIVVLSSVAAARARKSNFVYGAAKAALDASAQGLRDALHGTDVRVHLVRPGFVVSKMTTGLTPAPMAAVPEDVAEAVIRAVRSPVSRVLWVPGRLGPLMAVLRNVPAPVWRRIAGDR